MNDRKMASGTSASDAILSRTVRQETAKIVSSLSRSFGSLDVAEDAAASAIEEALGHWRVHGVPPRPGAWLMTAARHNAIDAVRRTQRYRDALSKVESSDSIQSASSEMDERVSLLFGCCHPSLSHEAQLALSLRAVLGLTTDQIAKATLEPSSTVGQRITRAKRKIGAAGVPLRIPEPEDRSAHLDIVLTVISVMYDSAHLRPGATADVDRNLADDALWLAEVVAATLPSEAEAHGLYALLLFHRARESARSVNGELVPMMQQDRTHWDSRLIAAAHDSLLQAAHLRNPGRWQIHAAIAACHSDAAQNELTDWAQILALYDMLLAYDKSPIVLLNRAVALAEVTTPAMALAETEKLEPHLKNYHLWHAVHAEFLERLGRRIEAQKAAETAHTMTMNKAERALLLARHNTQRND
ncbi:DUF6596 domain-containing protein [Lysinibacter sp. HNR]|uniref:RNA polymerase sigma factor n=1 Tax=Lysinibacter sp. HNR TaxID=3031408 RepID=UPI0024357664|nr:DUF6596 domain-containing protein [Lysinibacter sp. HNR]WGD37186.1 sigma factor-like helix-turn-helix DNA-binding protein [Lysinibacter sp. HNR]